MGVDTRITLNPGTRVRDVATVLAIATGVDWEKRYLGPTHPDSWFPMIEGLHVEGIKEIAECARIYFDSPQFGSIHVLYHHEWGEGQPGDSGILMRSTPLSLALAHTLVDFFGGSIDYSDSDDVSVDYEAPTKYRHAEDGEAWQAFQVALTTVHRVTNDNLLTFNEHAAYKIAPTS